MKNLAFALLVLAAATAAHGQTGEGTASYGLSIGEFDYDEGQGGIVDTVSSWRLMVGYQFMEHLAVEGGYGQTGTVRATTTRIDFLGFTPEGIPTFGPVDFDTSLEFRILTIRLLGVLPFDNGVSLLGGIGYADLKWKIKEVNANDPTDGFSGSFSSNEPAYYIGAQYDWDRIALRLAYEKYDFSGGIDANETSITFFYKL